MIEWCIIIYFLLSFLVMNQVQPQNDKHPVINTILCFFIGGLVFIIALITGIVKVVKGKE